MSFFHDHYHAVRFPIKEEGVPRGLRRAQLGAIHAIASHFTLTNEPALVVMPTGSGKTVVLIVSAFLQRARRVLVVTPGRLVRDQIREQFTKLAVLKALQVLPEELPNPKVFEVKERMTTGEQWDALREYDVVVATPNSASPAIPGNAVPPEDLFDLILVDEAHHSPARTWNDLFASFPRAKRLLVTATPFRRDKREIRGRIVYVYSLRDAYRDRVFGRIEYVAVDSFDRDPDVAIAKSAEQELVNDRALGYRHYLMVRTDSRTRANALAALYRNHTTLRLRTVHSDHSLGHIRKTVGILKVGDLDGVICVNMLGEGFDFPNLKIAAIHSPHKSLAVTLQFIGRFARTNAVDIGSAKFVAIPSDIEIERERLFGGDRAWEEIVPDLAHAKIDKEVRVRGILEGFHAMEAGALLPAPSLYSLRPYAHVKIYRMSGDVNMLSDPRLPPGFEIPEGYRWDNPDLNATVFVAREERRPKWATTDHFMGVEFHLFVLYYDAASRLIFINSTLRHNEAYEVIAQSFTSGSPKILPLNQINKVLLGMNNPEFFNVGMRNRLQNSNAESYRIVTGPSAQLGISASDGRLYHRGHVFGGDEASTIGFSSSSKVWSNARELVPNLIGWCQDLAGRLTSSQSVVTHSPLDHLDVGTTITEFPEGVLGALWDIDVFRDPPQVGYRDPDGCEGALSLLDIELTVDQERSGPRSIRVVLQGSQFRVDLDYVLNDDGWSFEAVDEVQLEQVWVERAHLDVSLIDYLNANPLEFFFNNFSRLLGQELFTGPGGTPSIEDGQFAVFDWAERRVEISREFGPCDDGRSSIHDCLESELLAFADVAFYDHGTGEVADFITFERHGESLEISFLHCKGSSGSSPGERVKDYYEVCQQVVKSLRWLENQPRLLKQIQHRLRVGSRFCKGDLDTLKELLSVTRRTHVAYRLVVVQPGISKAEVGALGPILASTSDYVAKSRGQRFEVWCSE